MTQAILLSALLLSILMTNAQENKSKSGGNGQNNNQLYTHTDKDGNKVTEIRSTGRSGRVIYKKGKDGKYTYEKHCSGEGWSRVVVIKLDENKKIVSVKTSQYAHSQNEPYGTLQLEYESKRQADGSLKGGEPYEAPTGPEHVKNWEKELQDQIGEIEKDDPDPVSINLVPCDPAIGSCSYKAEFSLGYSYLRADNGAAGLGMPLGVNVSAVYNLSPKFGLALDLSYHTGKKNDQKFDRQYALAGIQYKCDNCDEDAPVIFTHILAGYGRDGFKFMNFKNSNSGFVAAIGGGIDFKLNDKTAVKIKADAIPVFFTDDMQIDYRVGVGIGISSGCKTRLNKYKNITLKNY